MAYEDLYTGYLGEPADARGPYRIIHNLGTWHVDVSIHGYIAGSLDVVEIPEGVFPMGVWTWSTETENSIIVDTGNVVAAHWTVVVKRSRGAPA